MTGRMPVPPVRLLRPASRGTRNDNFLPLVTEALRTGVLLCVDDRQDACPTENGHGGDPLNDNSLGRCMPATGIALFLLTGKGCGLYSDARIWSRTSTRNLFGLVEHIYRLDLVDRDGRTISWY